MKIRLTERTRLHMRSILGRRIPQYFETQQMSLAVQRMMLRRIEETGETPEQFVNRLARIDERERLKAKRAQ